MSSLYPERDGRERFIKAVSVEGELLQGFQASFWYIKMETLCSLKQTQNIDIMQLVA